MDYAATGTDARARITAAGDLDTVEQLRVEFLGKQGSISGLLKTLGAMSPEHALRYFQLTPNKVVIVGGDRAEIILTALDTPTVAIVLTGNFVPSAAVLERAEERGVPLISVESDTVTAADDLRRLFGRLRVKERAKIDLIAELIESSVDLDRLVADLQA